MDYVFTKTETMTINCNHQEPDVALVDGIKRAGWQLDAVNDVQVVGFCEVCERPILEGDAYHSDQEGVMWCKPNCEGE